MFKKIQAIYKIRNKVNNKFYIGSAISIKARWCHHRDFLRKNKHHNEYLQRSWNKYGEDSFEFYVLEYCNHLNYDQLLEKEQWYLENTGCLDPKYGYNICPTADGDRQSESTKLKLKITSSGRVKSIETIEKLRKSSTGRKHSAITRIKMNVIRKGNKSNTGKKFSEEHKRKIGEKSKGNKVWLGRKHSEETKAKMSIVQKGLEKPKMYKPVEQILNGIVIGEFSSILKAALSINVASTNIVRCCKGKARSVKGFQWRYKKIEGTN